MFWLDETNPVIVLSIRYDRIDCFWFTLAHELAHIWNGDKRSLDSDITGANRITPVNEMEKRADEEGAEWLITNKDLRSLIARIGPYYSREDITLFARRIGVHPGIVVGQLQHRKEIGFQTLRDTLVKVRENVTTSSLTDGWGRQAKNFI
jgi:HTH-type transcriptional regulator/antitoxin HigA